jgi:hypothetical protein
MAFILHPSAEQLATMVQANSLCCCMATPKKSARKSVHLNLASKLFWLQEVAGKLAVSPHRKKGVQLWGYELFLGRFHCNFGSLGDMSSFVGRFHRGFGSLGTESLSADCF